jgi:hypothetical protein
MLAAKKHPDCEFIYCDTLKHEHPDNMRFLRDVEKWIGRPIKILGSKKYKDIYDVFDRTGWLVGVGGARCTTELKKNVRKSYQVEGDVHFFGLTCDEESRIDKFNDDNADIELEWILQDEGITKNDCYKIVQDAGIELPEMYKLGYNNNNCIGCVKGQAGYWNKIRIDFPEAFKRMADQERKMGVAINKSYAKQIELADGSILENPAQENGKTKRVRIFLDELHPEAGRDVPMPDIECGALCVTDSSNRQEAREQFDMRVNAGELTH